MGLLTLVGVAIAAAATALPVSFSRQPEPSKKPAPTTADAVLVRAESAADAALKWLKGKATEAGAAATDAADSAEKTWNDAVSEAKARGERTVQTGVSLFDASDASPPRWHALAATPADSRLPDRLVVLVHGLDEPGSIWNELAPAVHAADLPLAKFDYRNDQSLPASCEAMAAAMTDLKARGVSHVDLVCHSMGGLVARAVLTDDRWYAGDAAGGERLPAVERLILVATPNQGSPWTSLRALAEIREQFVRWVDSEGNDPAALLGFLSDGDGEAGPDLKPGSAFLAQLNARPLPKNVAITVFVGQIVDEDVADLQRLLDYPLAKDLLDDNQRRALAAGAADLRLQLGDGVVPRDSALLDGVEDTVTVSANHRSILNRWGILRRLGEDTTERQRTDPAPAIPIILVRLQRATDPH